MNEKLNILVSFDDVDNAGYDGCSDRCFMESAFDYRDKSNDYDLIIENPDGHCYNMAVASYYDMLDEYAEYEEVLFKAVITSQIHVEWYETYTIIKESRCCFLVRFYQEYDEDEDDEKDIIYIDEKPYVDTGYRKAFAFAALKFTDKDTTEGEEVEYKIWEAFEKYDEEYFKEY